MTPPQTDTPLPDQALFEESLAERTPRLLFRLGRFIAACGLVSIFGLVWSLLCIAQDTGGAAEDTEISIENTGVAVEVDGRPILVVYAHVGGFSPKERAAAIEQR